MKIINIDQRNGSVEIKLNYDIYPAEVVKHAKDDFKEAADIMIDDKIIIKPKDKGDLQVIGYEFCNY